MQTKTRYSYWLRPNGNIATAATAWVTSPTTAATTYGNIGDWNTAAVSNMYRLFYNKPTFNADIGAWNVASMTTMVNMFLSAAAFNANIGSWNTARVTTMAGMFYGATAFNGNISAWNTARVANMDSVRADTFCRRRAAAGVADALGRAPMWRSSCARRHRRCARAHV
jgi:surface protein